MMTMMLMMMIDVDDVDGPTTSQPWIRGSCVDHGLYSPVLHASVAGLLLEAVDLLK
jgi:hypothetical protein